VCGRNRARGGGYVSERQGKGQEKIERERGGEDKDEEGNDH